MRWRAVSTWSLLAGVRRRSASENCRRCCRSPWWVVTPPACGSWSTGYRPSSPTTTEPYTRTQPVFIYLWKTTDRSAAAVSVELDCIEQDLTSHSTHFRSFRRRWGDCGISRDCSQSPQCVRCWVVCVRPLLITVVCMCIIWKALCPYVLDARLRLWVSLEHAFTCVSTTNQAEQRSSATNLLARWEHERTTAWWAAGRYMCELSSLQKPAKSESTCRSADGVEQIGFITFIRINWHSEKCKQSNGYILLAVWNAPVEYRPTTNTVKPQLTKINRLNY